MTTNPTPRERAEELWARYGIPQPLVPVITDVITAAERAAREDERRKFEITEAVRWKMYSAEKEAAFRRGAEAMREMAACICDVTQADYRGADFAAKQIRAYDVSKLIPPTPTHADAPEVKP